METSLFQLYTHLHFIALETVPVLFRLSSFTSFYFPSHFQALLLLS